MSLAAGDRLGRYEILAPLGAGGMGEVYRARDSKLDREVAVKVLPKEYALDAGRLARLEREARAAAAVDHPNILAVHDVGSHQGTPYVVTELLEGTDFAQLVRTGGITVSKALEYAFEGAQGLAAAYARGILHRDLKTENVFLTV